jgi:hypothetical protein
MNAYVQPKKPDSPTPDTMIKRGDVGKYLGVGWRVVAGG